MFLINNRPATAWCYANILYYIVSQV